MAIIKRIGKSGRVSYRAQIWANNTIIATKTFHRKIDAEEWQRKESMQIDPLRPHRKITLSEFFKTIYWPQRKIAAGTAQDYLRIFQKWLEPTFGSMVLTSIQKSAIATHFTKLAENGMSKARINRVHTVMSAIFNRAVKMEYATKNPTTDIDWHKEDLHKIDRWTKIEARQFLDWAHRTKNPRFGFYHCAYETGMRVSELIALMWDCVDLNRGVIEVRRSLCKGTGELLQTTKSNKTRNIGISLALADTLRNERKKHHDHFVFMQLSGAPVTYTYIRKRFQQDQAEAGVKPISVHGIRHTFATHFVESGENVFDLQKILGHSDISTTMRYAAVSAQYLQSKAGAVSFSPKPIPNHSKKDDLDNSKK